MKYKLFSAIILTITITSSVLVYQQIHNTSELSELELTNIAALSQNENGGVIEVDCPGGKHECADINVNGTSFKFGKP